MSQLEKSLQNWFTWRWPDTTPMGVEDLRISSAFREDHQDFLQQVEKNPHRFQIEIFNIPDINEGELYYQVVQFLHANMYLIVKTPDDLAAVSRKYPEYGKYLLAVKVDDSHGCLYQMTYDEEKGIAVICSDVKGIIGERPGKKQ
jgi:hypothetical protein